MDEICAGLEKLLNNAKVLQLMAARSADLVDGQGTVEGGNDVIAQGRP